jgi:phage terminase large subunit
MKIQTTQLFQQIDNSLKEKKRYVFLRGSTRSGKTITALQYIIIQCLTNSGLIVTIARETQSSIKNTLLLDFIEVLEGLGIWIEKNYNKVDMVYRFPNKSIIRFIGLDDTTGKLRGMKQDIVFVDEVNTVDRNNWVQLDVRTERYLLAAYNPEITPNWWGLEYEKKDNGIMLHSTWRQNPFLSETIIRSILDLKTSDPDLYTIYSEGLIVEPREKIYRGFNVYYEKPNIKYKYIGIDWGFSNDECAVIEVGYDGDKNIYAKELLYETNLTNEDLAHKLLEMGIDKQSDIVVDSSEPKSREELKRLGIRTKPISAKGILYGIQKVKQYNLHIHSDSINLMDEHNNYKWKKDRSGRVTNQPTGKDHLLDALRYVVVEFIGGQNIKGKYNYMI